MAAIAQLGERQTEDLKVPGSIPGLGTLLMGQVRECAEEKSEKGQPPVLGREGPGSRVSALFSWGR